MLNDVVCSGLRPCTAISGRSTGRRPVRALQHYQHENSAVTCRQAAGIRRQLQQQQQRSSSLRQLSTSVRSAGRRHHSGSACIAQAFPDRERRPAKVVERTEKDIALESMQLESELRNKVSNAVENLGYRVRFCARSQSFCGAVM